MNDKKTKILYVVGDGSSYASWLIEQGWEVTKNKHNEDIDLVMFTGGADVSPSLYGQDENSLTSTNPTRDAAETVVFQDFYNRKIPMIGICRGSQFLTVMSGGSLFQHVRGHGGNHSIELSDGSNIVVTSTHHQMMNPFDMKDDEYQLLGWAKDIAKEGYGSKSYNPTKLDKEPEIVYYPKTRSFCVQCHPEFAFMPNVSKKAIYNILEEKLDECNMEKESMVA